MMNDKCNPSIKCSVTSCAYHAPENCCSLTQIKVGCCDTTPTQSEGTECCSFEPGKGAH